MIITLIAVAAVAVIGYFVYRHRAAVVAEAEADEKALKTSAANLYTKAKDIAEADASALKAYIKTDVEKAEAKL